MSLDISSILSDWPYEPGQVTVRKIRGQDGREKIQMRLDLGLLQMETSGRPDGQRPHGMESLLDYYEQQLQKFRQEHGGREVGFTLDEQACELLRSEGVMYYHRYLAQFVLEDFQAVERDTMRNIRLMDFCQNYAREESDRYILEQYRAYATMMCTRARGQMALRQNRPKAALAAVKHGLEEIRSFYKRFGQDKLANSSGEVAILKALIKEIENRLPVDPIQKLRHDLAKAVKEERYEQAAQLRDRLTKLQHRPEEESPPEPS